MNKKKTSSSAIVVRIFRLLFIPNRFYDIFKASFIYSFLSNFNAFYFVIIFPNSLKAGFKIEVVWWIAGQGPISWSSYTSCGRDQDSEKPSPSSTSSMGPGP